MNHRSDHAVREAIIVFLVAKLFQRFVLKNLINVLLQLALRGSIGCKEKAGVKDGIRRSLMACHEEDEGVASNIAGGQSSTGFCIDGLWRDSFI